MTTNYEDKILDTRCFIYLCIRERVCARGAIDCELLRRTTTLSHRARFGIHRILYYLINYSSLLVLPFRYFFFASIIAGNARARGVVAVGSQISVFQLFRGKSERSEKPLCQEVL